MGIELTTLHLLNRHIRAAASPTAKVLSLGKQDVYFDHPTAVAFFRARDIPYTEISESCIKRTDSFAWVAHADWPHYSRFLHQDTLLEMLGFRPENIVDLDVDPYESARIIHDLNKPIPDELAGQFDLVLDIGTSEHLFDVRQAFFNYHRLLKVGGSILHLNPAAEMNHGFININAGLLRDFYTANGFIENELKYVALPPREADAHYWIMSPEEVKEPVPGYTLIVFGSFTKVAEQQPVVPKQQLYQSLHAAWKVQVRAPVDGAALPPQKPAPSMTKRVAAIARHLAGPQYRIPGNRVSI